jgi:ketosteroid isomerase-like protein
VTIDDNRATAHAFFARYNDGDIAGAVDLLHEDVTWWVAGHRDEFPFAGLYTKDQIARLFGRMNARLTDGLRMQVHHSIAEDDRVAVEVSSRGTLHNGRVYTNQYHTLLRFRDGRIHEVREYNDTRHAYEVWARE